MFLLVLHANQEWVAAHDQATSDQVVEAIAALATAPPLPDRECEDKARPWLFRFASFDDLYRCRQELQTRFPGAFTKLNDPVGKTALVEVASLKREDPSKLDIFDRDHCQS